MIFAQWHSLTPKANSEASPVSYSGLYGLGEFPMHTDMAHWRMPPRYLVLWAQAGSIDVKTPLLDSSKLIESLVIKLNP
jgi:L-asparagine oxygenase